MGKEKCDCEIEQLNVNHIERITVHGGISINQMYSRSYSQKQHMKKFHMGQTQVRKVGGST